MVWASDTLPVVLFLSLPWRGTPLLSLVYRILMILIIAIIINIIMIAIVTVNVVITGIIIIMKTCFFLLLLFSLMLLLMMWLFLVIYFLNQSVWVLQTIAFRVWKMCTLFSVLFNLPVVLRGGAIVCLAREQITTIVQWSFYHIKKSHSAKLAIDIYWEYTDVYL